MGLGGVDPPQQQYLWGLTPPSSTRPRGVNPPQQHQTFPPMGGLTPPFEAVPEGFWAQEGLENYLGLRGFILIELGTIRSDQTCIFMLGGCPILEHSYSYIALTITITIAMWHGDCHGNSHRNSHGYMSDMSDMSDTVRHV